MLWKNSNMCDNAGKKCRVQNYIELIYDLNYIELNNLNYVLILIHRKNTIMQKLKYLKLFLPSTQF